jgi:putative membrane protein insertion efficiency factor
VSANSFLVAFSDGKPVPTFPENALEVVRQAPRRAGSGLVRLYRYTLSGLVGFECRHLPTCSAYAEEAIGRFGLWPGAWMALARLLRCHPFGTSGLDFVPATPPAGARWYLPWRYGRWRGTNGEPQAIGGVDEKPARR